MRTHVHAVGGALWAAAVMTIGDWVWARFIPSHRAVFGLAHGLALCLAIGLYLGFLRRRPVRGAGAGAVIGLAAAIGFYLLAFAIGWGAMFVAWMGFWIGFGFLVARGMGEPLRPHSSAWFRGAMAAIGSGLGFYAISGIWTRPRPGGPDYPYNFLCWTVAFLPGFAALLLSRPSSVRPSGR